MCGQKIELKKKNGRKEVSSLHFTSSLSNLQLQQKFTKSSINFNKSSPKVHQLQQKFTGSPKKFTRGSPNSPHSSVIHAWVTVNPHPHTHSVNPFPNPAFHPSSCESSFRLSLLLLIGSHQETTREAAQPRMKKKKIKK